MRQVTGIYTISCLLLCSTAVVAQEISGKVVDAITRKSLESVNVYLCRASDSSLVTGATTGRSGRFSIAGISIGSYFLRFSLLSYDQRILSHIRLEPQLQSLDIGTVELTEKPVSLNEVVTTGEKSLIIQDIDRKVYNVDKDIAAVSGSASDLLRNIPSVEVDLEGNVSLRGSPDVLILINGKNSPLMGRNRAEVIQQMPANTIERIEVITNPSARYRPDGTAGIINIELKKDADKGVNGSLSANVGKDARHGGNFRFNVRPAETNLFCGYSLRRDIRNRFNSDMRILDPGTAVTSTYRQEGSASANPRSHMGTLGIEHEFNSGTTASLSGDYFSNRMTMDDLTTIVREDSGAAAFSERATGEESSEEEVGLRLAVEHKFPDKRHEIRFELQSSQEREEEQTLAKTYFAGLGMPTEGEKVTNMQVQRSTELTAEYVRPFGEESQLEAGYTAEITGFDCDAAAESFGGEGRTYVLDLSMTHRFLHDQSLHALYATFRSAFGPVSVMGGLRGEQVYRTSNLVTLGTEAVSNYAALYPSLHLLYRVLPALELQLNYSRRTHRPHADELNPFPEYRDPRNVTVGNPRLLPEYINSYEIGCKMEHELFSVVPSLYYRYTSNRFTSVVQPLNDSTLVTIEENLAEDRSAGVEVVFSGGIRDLFSLTASWNGFHNMIDAGNLGYGSTRSVWSWSGTLSCNVDIGSSTRIQLNGNYRSARLTPQGSYDPTGAVNIGVRQDLFNRRLTTTLTVADLFQTMRHELYLESPELVQHSYGIRDSRVFVLSVTYRFGTQQNENDEDILLYDEALE